ncbi:Ras-related protein [Acrasis kona]|uniref:Ras-related protein n=1 Tax=Acrasis kona TaxID=1008807 RepID=A0AAW2ZKT3_9EUKA
MFYVLEDEDVQDVLSKCLCFKEQIKKFFSLDITDKQRTSSTENDSGYTNNDIKQQFQIRINKTEFYDDDLSQLGLAAFSSCFSYCRQFLIDWIQNHQNKANVTITTYLMDALNKLTDPTFSVLIATEYYSHSDATDYCPAHLDSGLITLCVSPEEGLQLYSEENQAWLNVNGPNKLILLFGESLQQITDGVARANLHKVSKTSVNRFSLVFKFRMDPAILSPRNLSDYQAILEGEQRSVYNHVDESKMPVDVLEMVFLFLPYNSICTCELVSKHWKKVACSNYIWREQYKMYYGKNDVIVISWKDLFINKVCTKPKDELLHSLSKCVFGSTEVNLKLVVVGDGAVGKTCLIIVYASKKFPTTYMPTVFDAFTTRTKIDDASVYFALWDTAGQDDYDQLRPFLYPETNVFLILFSVDNRASFKNVKTKWMPELKNYSATPMILVGTKIDKRETEDCVMFKEGLEMAKDIGAFGYFEISSLNLAGVERLFDCAARVGLHHSMKIPFYASVKSKKKKCTVQ